MRRILIIGCSGSGKSTLSFILSERLHLPLVHLDKLWWLPGWKTDTRENFDAKLAVELRKDSWIIEGDFNRTIPERLKFADTVLAFRLPRYLCIWRVIKRVFSSYGRIRPDMAEGCPERVDWDFMKYVWNYNRNILPEVETALKDFKGKIITFNSPDQVNTFLKSLDKNA